MKAKPGNMEDFIDTPDLDAILREYHENREVLAHDQEEFDKRMEAERAKMEAGK